MCFLALIYSTHRARTSPWWVLAMTMSFCFLVLVKGAFAMFALVGAALWLIVVPVPEGGPNRWAWAGLAAAVATAALMLAGYEALYVRTTGESFLEFYRSTRLGESIRFNDLKRRFARARQRGMVSPQARVVCRPVEPGGVCRRSGSGSGPGLRAAPSPFEPTAERGLVWAFLLTAVFITVLSPANVRAERFIFPTYFAIAQLESWPRCERQAGVRSLAASADRYGALPIAVWMADVPAQPGEQSPCC